MLEAFLGLRPARAGPGALEVLLLGTEPVRGVGKVSGNRNGEVEESLTPNTKPHIPEPHVRLHTRDPVYPQIPTVGL